MAKLFVFAIGGTGERVMRSLTMLLSAGVPTFDNYEVFPIIIDYDENNADKTRTVNLLKNYNEVHTAAFTAHGSGHGEANQYFAPRLVNLTGLSDYVFPFQSNEPNLRFRDYIAYDHLSESTGTLPTRKMLSSVYDESDAADTELNLNMNVGFKGNPNIGSVVFHKIGETTEFSAFVTRFNPQQGDKVVIIGSLFGGTGASGIPEIVKAINARVSNATASIGTILVLPYFRPAEQRGGAIQASRFNSKTKAALSYYSDSGIKDMINSIYYVGDPYPTVIPYCEGGVGQKNNANLVELIAAMMIEHFVSGRTQVTPANKEFKFAIDADIEVREESNDRQRLFVNDFDNASKTGVLNYLIQLAIGLKFFKDEICSKNLSKSLFYKYLNLDAAIKGDDVVADARENKLRDLCTALRKFYYEYQQWMRELDFAGDGDDIQANSHRFALCDMDKDYQDLVLKMAQSADRNASIFSQVRGVFTSRPKLTADFLEARMNNQIKDDGRGGGHYDTKKNALREGHQAEWVFMDILHAASGEGFLQLQ